MTYKTNQDLIEQQISFWDEDLAQPGDYINKKIEEISLKDLTLPDAEVLKIYTSDPKDLLKTSNLAEAIKNGLALPPILIDSAGNVIDGYHRYLAAQTLGLTLIPCLRLNRKTF